MKVTCNSHHCYQFGILLSILCNNKNFKYIFTYIACKTVKMGKNKTLFRQMKIN